MKINSNLYLRVVFIIGCVVDGIIAINWLLIVFGINLPSIPSGLVGSGIDYRHTMLVNTLFMSGWSILLLWASFKPEERRVLGIITAILLFLSIVVDLLFYQNILSGIGFIFGICKRSVLVFIFSSSYFYSVFSKK